MERDSFIFYKSFYEAIAEADAKIQNEVFNAICKKALYEEDTKLTGVSKMLYTLIKPQLEANTKRYEDGKKGGRPKKETTGLTKEKTSGFENKKPNKNENVNVNDNENVNNNNNIDDSCVDGLQEIIDFYNNNIGMITPYAVDIFTDYTKEMTKDLIIYAMKKSVEANVKTIQYIKGILNNWSKSGIKTLVEAEKEDMKFEQNKSQRNNRKDFSEVEDF